jgi:hypothetical protein
VQTPVPQGAGVFITTGRYDTLGYVISQLVTRSIVVWQSVNSFTMNSSGGCSELLVGLSFPPASPGYAKFKDAYLWIVVVLGYVATCHFPAN